MKILLRLVTVLVANCCFGSTRAQQTTGEPAATPSSTSPAPSFAKYQSTAGEPASTPSRSPAPSLGESQSTTDQGNGDIQSPSDLIESSIIINDSRWYDNNGVEINSNDGGHITFSK